MEQQDANMIVLTIIKNNLVKNDLSRFNYLLLLLFFVNCNSKHSEDITKVENKLMPKNNSINVNDSLTITINNVPGETNTEFIYMNKDLVAINLEFENSTKKNKNITKKIPKIYSNDFIIMFRSFVVINNKSNIFKHDYYIKHEVNNINFEFKKGNISLKTRDDRIIILDDIYKQYSDVYRKNYLASNTNNQLKIKSLENLFEENKKIFSSSNDKTKLATNELEFLNRLSVIKGNDKRVVQYLKKIKNPIWSSTLAGLFYHNLESIKDSIYKINLNDKNFSDSYRQILPIEISWHLQINKDNQYSSYEKNLGWLKRTEYYKKNKTNIDINLKPKNKNEDLISKKINLFSVRDESNNELNIKKIIQQHTSKYYLLDFWATWCAPCIQNMKSIHNMELPKNLDIIYISMDKSINREKWLTKTNELNLSNSYLFIENENNKKTIQEIELNQLPRYILLDKNFNVLNFNMITPQEGDFLKELKNLVKD
jgi:thiol-disulfide isomerase/thioredoxin